jgi:large subunit ribosomal protein L10
LECFPVFALCAETVFCGLPHQNFDERRNTRLAINKKRKEELHDEYVALLKQAKGIVVTEYRGMTVKQLSDLRAKLRESNSGLVVTKNTILKIALREVGMAVPDKMLAGPVAVAVAYEDVGKTITTILEHSGTNEVFVVKGGVIGATAIAGKDLDAVSKLPSLDVLRSQLVGMVTMPLGQLLGLMTEPSRQVVAVIQAATDGIVNVVAAYSQKDAA